MPNRISPHLFTLLLLFAMAGCSKTSPSIDKVNTRPQTAPATPEAIASSAVAERVGVMPESVEIVSVSAVEFRDSSLDCPQAGMAYMQVITPGYVVIARATGRNFDVRVSGKRGLICDKQSGRKPEPARNR